MRNSKKDNLKKKGAIYGITTTAAGSALLEVLLAIAVFTGGLLIVAIFVIDVMRTSQQAQDVNQALLIASEGIEAVKAIRDNDFNDIYGNDGTHGLDLTAGDWSFSGTSDTVDLGDYGKSFERSIVISEASVGDDAAATTSVKLIESRVSWGGITGDSTTTIQTFITNWER